MADMELVIKISKEDYIQIAKKHCLPSCDDKTLRKFVYEKIVNGTPLPKGHGRLFDERDIINGSNYEDIGNRLYVLKPIIEADKEI